MLILSFLKFNTFFIWLKNSKHFKSININTQP